MQYDGKNVRFDILDTCKAGLQLDTCLSYEKAQLFLLKKQGTY